MERSEQLLQRASRGDSGAVGELLAQQLPGLQAFVRLRMGRMLRMREDSGDLVQSVCADILRNLDRFQYQGEANFRCWLFTTAARKIADRCDHHQAGKRDLRREAGYGGADAQPLLAAQYRTIMTPSARVMAAEEVARMEECFEKLSEEEREVILLAKIVGLSRAEIGAQMGKSEGAVRTLLSRALVRLSDLLVSPG
ncbi:MAG: sigma-70 family RNA polymerase sigma factor [Planctomycetota bacterium]|nr:MAG: sigma-70 family RNA polymerase sigma factor [Planctomycetota bacterium]